MTATELLAKADESSAVAQEAFAAGRPDVGAEALVLAAHLVRLARLQQQIAEVYDHAR